MTSRFPAPPPDIHRRSYPPVNSGGGVVRNRNHRSFHGRDATRHVSGPQRWSAPYSMTKKEARDPSAAKSDKDSDTNINRTSYREPKPLIISPTTTPDTNSTLQPLTASDPSALPRLDPTSPTHARRIQQRRRQILFGKNTTGYEEYTKRIPKEKRMRNSMEHPSTPDPTVDMSVKRWQGLVNAWRRALHKFDPPGMIDGGDKGEGITLAPRPYLTQQEEEIAQAKATGLQVAFGNMVVDRECRGFGVRVGESDEAVNESGGKEELEEEQAYRALLWREEEGEKDFLEEDCDSDDDVL
ncbi:hypothetical protein HJC23_001239 [Cyclotella cryptica]|uniref:Histone RNA hairpin-binding protein RNA-binding domain-containing protein n=1 Tax=Cyclotella cryptica TaxID=29204 RepID=A0ABD3QN70_9STRA|eukprot:CCRYP_003887-RA/>CCRYP_003887-RA protein AED:0.00 eAED:0.00 QI:203/-1/1/1/-1/1/1/363/297